MNSYITSAQQLYYAWDLSHKKSKSDDSKFTGVLSEAKVDLNPHQVEAALFAFKSPLSKGAILADEVGLGKTIEAGIILSELWAEHKRSIIIIVPASLRNQWNMELFEKFHLSSLILEGRNYKELKESGKNPFIDNEHIIICSYNFAVLYAKELKVIRWDLVVIDEAHKLRNVYKKKNIVGNSVRETFHHCKKILLTATPLQNNIKELYGLISIIDSQFFSSINTFELQYNKVATRDNARYGELKSRLNRIVYRTLRNQVKEYVNYTKRIAFVQEYESSTSEIELYEKVNGYLQREGTYGMPESIRPMLSLLVRKIMSSSAYALSFTLDRIVQRLYEYKKTGKMNSLFSIDKEEYNIPIEQNQYADIDDYCIDNKVIGTIDDEIAELRRYQNMAKFIVNETKAKKLLVALEKTFTKNVKLGAPRKALIFTESRRTQEYLKAFLNRNGYRNKVVCFNGTNNDEESKAIYRNFLSTYAGTNRISGSTVIDKKQSIIDYFKTDAEIMIATESGAEGINLQFCSLIVNYDMPWNPQRIEQRIGRCHRYGQKFDVLVVNFVNQLNQADRRVYELLNDKFNLFDGVFGCSDEVLGSLESGLDFEHKLNHIYQTCRTEREITDAFDQLRQELDEMIQERITKTKKSLLENFDKEVIDKLKIRRGKDKRRVSSYNKHFWQLAISILRNSISDIDNTAMTFVLNEFLGSNIPTGTYILNKDNGNYHQLRVSHPLGEYIIKKAMALNVHDSVAVFNVDQLSTRQMLLEQHKGESGIAVVYKVEAFNNYDNEEYLIFCAMTDEGVPLPCEFAQKMMEVIPTSENKIRLDEAVLLRFKSDFSNQLNLLKADIKEKSDEYVCFEIDKYEAWSNDQVYTLENEVIVLRKEHEALKRQVRKERNAHAKLILLEEERKRGQILRKKQNILFEMEDDCEVKVEKMTSKLWAEMEANVKTSVMFKFRWKLVGN